MQTLDLHGRLENLETRMTMDEIYSDTNAYSTAKFSIKTCRVTAKFSGCSNRRVNQLNEAFALRRAYAPRRQRRK